MCFNSALNYVIWRIAFNTVHISRQIYQNSSQKLEKFSTPITQLRDAWEITLKLYLSVNVLKKHESTNWGHSFYVSYKTDGTTILRGQPSHAKV